MACGVLQTQSFPARSRWLCKILLSRSVEVPTASLSKHYCIWCTGDGECLAVSVNQFCCTLTYCKQLMFGKSVF